MKHHKTDPNFKLIYLGSVNGFLANSFYRDCQEKGPTLILVKNEHGRLFGGFTTNNWKEPTIIWNKTERQHKYYYQTFSGPNAVLFSLDLKKVFRLYKGRTSFKLDQETNIAGPLLGELIIGNDCFTTASSSFNVGKYFDAQGILSENIAGRDSSRIKDYAVFTVS